MARKSKMQIKREILGDRGGSLLEGYRKQFPNAHESVLMQLAYWTELFENAAEIVGSDGRGGIQVFQSGASNVSPEFNIMKEAQKNQLSIWRQLNMFNLDPQDDEDIEGILKLG